MTSPSLKVAWVAGHDLNAVGGAEMSDRAFIEHAPRYGVTVDHMATVPASGVYDRVIASRPDMLAPDAVDRLAAMEPVILAHSFMSQVAAHAKPLLEASRLFFAVSPAHLAAEQEWLSVREWATTLLWLDTAALYPERKQDFALWPHRDAWHKDLPRGQEWARDKGVDLVVMHDRPQPEVHAAMRRARWVVLFSKGIAEPGNRAITEGYLAGCEPVTDEWVWSLSWGYSREEMRAAVEGAPAAFWERVKGL